MHVGHDVLAALIQPQLFRLAGVKLGARRAARPQRQRLRLRLRLALLRSVGGSQQQRQRSDREYAPQTKLS
jgi:hypothetical protein